MTVLYFISATQKSCRIAWEVTMEFKRFNYSTLEELIWNAKSMGIDLNFSDHLELLKKPVIIDGFKIPNSLAVHPMEGNDGNTDGTPGELTTRRYRRFAKGGAGLLWFEAIAVVPEGKAGARQLFINENNVKAFEVLVQETRATAWKEYGEGFNPMCIAQLTHSGRFSKPHGKPEPIISYHNPVLNTRLNLEPDYPVITDDQLERLEEEYEKAAVLASKAGFDGVDVKCCHRYLNSELLSAFTRKGKYGETFEGRTRFLRNIVGRIRSRLGEKFIVTTRLNIYDGISWPYGWGTDKEDCRKYDLEEPLKFIGLLSKQGVKMVNLTMGTPYYNPHVNRPYDMGGYVPEEHPLEGVERLIKGIGEVQKTFPEMVVAGVGYSWLRQLSPYLAAGCIEKGLVTIAGYGREAIAYPDFARDILLKGAIDREKCCIACGKCAELLRAGYTAGCVVRDSEVYLPVYKELKGGK